LRVANQNSIVLGSAETIEDNRFTRLGNEMKHFVAKLVEVFGHLGDAAESLDDFRYTNPCSGIVLKKEDSTVEDFI
jgi:hypothetical protein